LLATGSLTAAGASEPTPVEFRFAARVGAKPLHCGVTYPGVGVSKASILLQDFRVYVSAFRLVTKKGDEVPVTLASDPVWQSEHVALLDFEDATGNCNGNGPTNDRVRGTVPAGDYVGVVFEIGVPFAVNHQDVMLAGPPLNFTALAWPWAAGYKFTTIDFDTKPLGEPTMVAVDGTGMKASASGFSVHLGSTECASRGPRVPPNAPCGNPNRATYRLDSFDATKDVLVLDLGSLLADTDVTVNMPGSPSGCMSSPKDDDCVGIMNRFGLPFRDKASVGQKFVSVERRP
jgi:uncharacterized repeat protein (TIGR04052 family)